MSHTMSGRTDADLIEAVKVGDRDAFAQIVSRYQGLVCGITYSGTGDVATSEELAQDVVRSFGFNQDISGDELVISIVELGTLLYEENQPKCAELAFESVIAASGISGATQVVAAAALAARRCLAELLYAAGDPWKAISQFEALLLSNPQDGEAFRQLGDCYADLGVEEAARLCYGKSQEILPSTPGGGGSAHSA